MVVVVVAVSGHFALGTGPNAYGNIALSSMDWICILCEYFVQIVVSSYLGEWKIFYF